MIQLRCASPFQTGTSRTSLRISDHIGYVICHLHKVRLHIESCLTGSGTTDDNHILILQDLTVGVLVASALKLVVYYRSKNAKKFRQGVEYGSARWGNRKDIEPFMDPVFENNVILTETERLTMNSRPKAPKYARRVSTLTITFPSFVWMSFAL